MCPNGVEWKELGEVCEIKTGKGVTQKDAVADGIYPIISGGKEPMGFIGTKNRNANCVTISRVGANAGFVSFITTDFYLNDKCFSVIPYAQYADDINLCFLYYYLKFQEESIIALQSAGGVPTINTQKVGGISIPLPPLEIQNRIVEILDHFTNLTANLTAELALRRKQFEFYREKLLSLDGVVPGVEWKALGGVCEYSKKRIVAAELNNTNYVSVENLLQNKKGKTQSECCPDAGCWTKFEVGDVLIGNIRPYLRKIWLADITGGTNGDVLVIHIKDSDVLCPSYLYFILSSEDFFTYDTSNSKGAKMPRGDKSAVMAYSFPLPPLAVQQSIVEKLDKFTALIVNIEKELDLRQKQYVYYREQLLTF